jgi:hypothetical protein
MHRGSVDTVRMRGLLHSMLKVRSLQAERVATVLVSAGISFGVATLLFRTFHRNSVDVPFYDDWTLADLLDKQARGLLGVSDFWRNNNEHRVPFPLLVMVATARLTGMNLRAQMFESLLCLCGGCALAIAALRRLARGLGVSAAPGLCLITTFLLTRTQSNNVLWGWQLTLTMGYVFGTLALFLVAPMGGSPITSPMTPSWRRLGLAIAAAIVSQYSFATGIALWPIGLVVLALRPGIHRVRKATTWAVTGAISTLAYLHGINHVGATTRAGLSTTADYFLTQLGSPFVWRGWDCAVGVRCADVHHEPRLAGIVGLVLLVACALYLAWIRRLTIASSIIAWASWAIASAALTSTGRAGLGFEQALLSRYVTLVIPLWGSLAILVPIVVQHHFAHRKRAVYQTESLPNTQTFSQPPIRHLSGAVLVTTAISATLSIGLTRRMGATDESAAAYRRGLLIARAALRQPHPTNEQLVIVFARVDEVRRLLPTLERQRISVYRKPRSQHVVRATP